MRGLHGVHFIGTGEAMLEMELALERMRSACVTHSVEAARRALNGFYGVIMRQSKDAIVTRCEVGDTGGLSIGC